MVIKTIIFDIGGVILKIDNKKICKKLTKYCDFSSKKILDTIFRNETFKDFEKGKLSGKEFFKIVKKKLNLDLGYEEFKKIFQSNMAGYNKQVVKTILKCKGKYRVLLLSNNNSLHYGYQSVTSSFIFSHANRRIISFQVKTRKPEKKIYKIAIKHAKARPREIIYFDDLKKNIIAAKKMGINAVYFTKSIKLGKILKKYNISL